jgi:amidohydrolase
MKKIKKEVSSIKEELISLRRNFHQCPELGMQEFKTAQTIIEYLKNLGLSVVTHIGGTGVVAVLEGTSPGKTLLLRADMDALPLYDKKKVKYRSQNDGVMHACGHDGHMSILLGVAKVLSQKKDQLCGRIKFVFQPAEEPGTGAKAMIDDGVLTNPIVDAAIALHLMSTEPLQNVLTKTGALMAGSDTFFITIKGKGGHAGLANDTVDAIYIASLIVSNLQTQIRKQLSPTTPFVLHFGKIKGGDAENIVADHAELVGTLRTTDLAIRAKILKQMDQAIKGITNSMGGSYELQFEDSHSPPVINDKKITELITKIARNTVGEEHVHEAELTMGGEDFSFFLNKVPGCMFFVGAGDLTNTNYIPHHNSLFDIDEDSLVIGTEIMIGVALEYLKQNPENTSKDSGSEAGMTI